MDNVSIQQKIDNWLKSNQSYAAKPTEEIISAMIEANVLTLSETQEISVFGIDTVNKETPILPNTKPKKSREEVLETLEGQLITLATQVIEVENNNSFVETAWSWIKDKTGYGDSLKNVKIALQKDMELFDKLKNNEKIDFQKDEFPYDANEIELLLEGQLELKSQKALNDYQEGQEMASDMVGDLTSGIGAVCLYSAIVLTGGTATIPIAIGAAIASGGVIKAGTKALDNLGSEKKYNTLGKDLLTGGFSGLLAPVTAGIGGVAGKCIAKTFGVQATKTLGKTSIEQGTKASIKEIAKNALLNPAGYKYKGGTVLTRASAYGTEMGVDGMLGGGIDGAYRATLEGENIGDAFISGTVGGLILSPVIGGGFKLAGKGASKIAEKIWDSNAPLPPLTTPNKYTIQTPDKVKIKINELGEDAKQLHNKLKELAFNGYEYLFKICLDDNGNVIPEARDRIFKLLTKAPQIAELLNNNLKFYSLEDVNKLAKMAASCIIELHQSPRGIGSCLENAMDENGYVDSFLLDRVYQIFDKSFMHMSEFQDVLYVALTKDNNWKKSFDINVLDAIEEGIDIEDINLCKDVNGIFQKGNLEGLNYLKTIFSAEHTAKLQETIFNACKNQDGIILYPKLKKYTEILNSGHFNMVDTNHMILPLIFNAKNEYQPEIYKKLIKDFDEVFIRNNYSFLEPNIKALYKSGNDAGVEKLLTRISTLTQKEDINVALMIQPLAKMSDDEFNKFHTELKKNSFTLDLINKSNKFLAIIIEDGKFNEELFNIGLDYWKKGIHPEELSYYINVLETDYPNISFEDKNRFINKLISKLNPNYQQQLNERESLNLIEIYRFILNKQKPEYADIALDLADKKVDITTIERTIQTIFNYSVDQPEFLKRVEYINENGFGEHTLDLLRMFSTSSYEAFDDAGIEKCIKLKERGCNPQIITNNSYLTDSQRFDILEGVEKAVFAKRNILKTGTEELSDKDLFEFVYKNGYADIFVFLDSFDLPVLEASFGLKIDGVIEFLEKFNDFSIDLDDHTKAELIMALNPKKALQDKLQNIQNKIKSLKSSFKYVAASGDKDALNNLKKQINDATTQERKIQAYIKEATLEPLETINKIRTLMAFAPHELWELLALIKPNMASDEMIETIKKDPAIMQAFENRANKNQDLKTWYSHNILKPHNDGVWNKTINRKIYEKLNIEYDEALAQKLQLHKSKYLPEILSSDDVFKHNFKELIRVIQENPNLSVKDALNNLEQNIFTRNQFKKLGIDYDKWTTVDKNHFKTVQVELDVEEAKSAAIKNLEEDLSNITFNTLPQSELKKIFDDLAKINVTIKDVKELAYDADGYQLPDKIVKKLYIDGQPVEFKDLAKIISTIKNSINSNEFWTKEHPDALINDIKNTMYNHLMKLRDTEIKNAINLKTNQVSNLEIHQIDMNDISHALFLGNHGHCCTAVGTGINQFSAPTYIMNKCISGIEIMDGDQFVGNTMCYIAKVDGKTALVLDNIEVAQRYQDNDQIRDAFMEYARDLCKRIGQPNMPIYAGPYRHKLNMNIYKQSEKMLEIQGSTGDQEVYIDYITDGREIDNIKKDRVNLFRIS